MFASIKSASFNSGLPVAGARPPAATCNRKCLENCAEPRISPMAIPFRARVIPSGLISAGRQRSTRTQIKLQHHSRAASGKSAGETRTGDPAPWLTLAPATARILSMLARSAASVAFGQAIRPEDVRRA